MDNHIKIRMLATGQVIELVPVAAFEKLNSGLAVLVLEETREFFGGALNAMKNVAAKFISKAAR